MRPENTAGVVRAVLSNGLTQSTPLKFFYSGPMFRYERPQKGRFRQFHQIGVELLGVPQPQADIEVIALRPPYPRRTRHRRARRAGTEHAGRPGKPRRLSRGAGRVFLSAHIAICRRTASAGLTRNPLRILDSKDPGDIRAQRRRAGVRPLPERCVARLFAEVRDGLDRLGIAYRLNPRLVRGLDYYTHTVFEFVTTDLGAQGTVLAGGRYDGLVELMGGPAMPGVGWAAGIERLAMLIAEPPPPPRPIALVPIGEQRRALALRHRRGCCATTGSSSISAIPATSGAACAAPTGSALAPRVLLGDDELARGAAPCAISTAASRARCRSRDLAARL